VTLPELVLDDLTWADLVDEARRAIPAASDGRWTLHAPIDPGMTLLELLASELEQRLFTLDRVPDTLIRAVMRLLFGQGVGPRPAQAAVTVLHLAGAGTPVGVPIGTELRQTAREELVLTTEHSAIPVPGARIIRLEVRGTDVWPQLASGEPVAVFGPTGRDGAVVQLAAAAPAPEHRLYVAVEDPTVPAGWLPGTEPPRAAGRLGAVPPRGLGWIRDDGSAVFLDGDGQPLPPDALGALTRPLPGREDADPPCERPLEDLGALAQRHAPRWEALMGDEAWPLRVEDGTAGLRISGIVRLRPPAGRPFPATVRLRISPPSARAPLHPVVSALVPNAAIARHRRRVTEEAVAAEPLLPLPRRELPLDAATPHVDRPLDRVMDGAGSSSLTVEHPDGTEESFEAVDDLAFSRPGQRHLQVDRSRGAFRFGDGAAGRIPRWEQGARLQLHYWLGGGVPPEVGPDVDFTGPAGLSARTVCRLSWGDEPETAESARARSAEQLARSTRAVTASDIEAIAQAVPGVSLARVHVQSALDPRHPGAVVPDSVTVVCLPAVPRRNRGDLAADPAPGLDEVSRAAIAQTLSRARLVGSQIHVRGPVWRTVDLDVGLRVFAPDAAALLRRAEAALRHFLDPLVGGPRADGWPFGGPVVPADLSALLQRMLGRLGEVRNVQVGEPGGTPTNCDPLPLRAEELPLLHRVTLTPEPSADGGR
jgi:hypothetical protein